MHRYPCAITAGPGPVSFSPRTSPRRHTYKLPQPLPLLGQVDELFAHLVQPGGEPRPVLRQCLVHVQRFFVRPDKRPIAIPAALIISRPFCFSLHTLTATHPALQ